MRRLLRIFLSFFIICIVFYHSLLPLSPSEDELSTSNVYDNNKVQVFSPSKSTSNVAICLIVKNETLYIDEWLDYNIALGFSPIIIYDNTKTFELNNSLHSGIYTWYETREDIWEYIQLIHFPEYPGQVKAYQRCLKQEAANSTYAALFDVDEFLVLKKHDNVVDFMDEYCKEDCGELSVNWLMMSESNETSYSPVPITKRNVHGERYGTMKNIVRPNYAAEQIEYGWHTVTLSKGYMVDTNGKTRIANGQGGYSVRQENKDGPFDIAVLHHYAFKSKQELDFKLCSRGNALEKDGVKATCNSKYYTLHQDKLNYNDDAWKQLKRMVPKYRIYDESTNKDTVMEKDTPIQNVNIPTTQQQGTWKISNRQPYMGNLSCIFEVAHWNLESFKKPIDLEKRRQCGKLQYIPYEGYKPPNASDIFDKLVNGTTIYFIGDSMTCQSGADFLCLMASISEITRKEIVRLPPKNWCNGANECEVNFDGYTGWNHAKATFRSFGPKRIYIHVVAAIEYGRVGELTKYLNNAKKGDTFVLNQGLHKRRDRGHDFLLNSFIKNKEVIKAAKGKGAHIVWRETTGAHFHTQDGYYDDSIKALQTTKSAVCVPSSDINKEKSKAWDDVGLVPFLKSLDIPILETWEATFLAQEWCHVGQGMDCVHWLQPGPTSYLSEALLNYIINDI